MKFLLFASLEAALRTNLGSKSDGATSRPPRTSFPRPKFVPKRSQSIKTDMKCPSDLQYIGFYRSDWPSPGLILSLDLHLLFKWGLKIDLLSVNTIRTGLLPPIVASMHFFEPLSCWDCAKWTSYRFLSIKAALGQNSLSRSIVKYGTKRKRWRQSIDFYRFREPSSSSIFFLNLDPFQLCLLDALFLSGFSSTFCKILRENKPN